MDIFSAVFFSLVFLSCFPHYCHPAQEQNKSVLPHAETTTTWIGLSRFYKRLSTLTNASKAILIPKTPPVNYRESNFQSRKQFDFKTKTVYRRAANICDCGRRRKSKVIGGQSVRSSHDYPWMVALFRQGFRFICGGTLITKKHVLTAAHCVYNHEELPSDVTVVLGIHNIADLGNGSSNISIVKIITHASYEPENQSYDIAIIQLEKAVDSDLISPACVPQADTTFPNNHSIILGWGATESENMSNVLQEGRIQVFPQSECKRIYKYEAINQGIICGGRRQGGVDSCKGDSGGPLMQKKKGRYFIVGIASWGYGCGRKRFPGIYTRVSYFSRWITENVSNDDCLL